MYTIEVAPIVYTYAFYIAVTCCAAALSLVLYKLREVNNPVASPNALLTYFFVGTIGWSFMAIRDILDIPVQIQINALFYILAGFVFLEAVCGFFKNKRKRWFVIGFHIIAILFALLAKDLKEAMIVTSFYSLGVYPIVAMKTFFSARRKCNIGLAIVSVSTVLISITSLAQIFLIIVFNSTNIAFATIIISASAMYILSGIGFISAILVADQTKLVYQILHDPLTSLLNRRGLDFSVGPVIAQAKRNQTPISSIAIDIDFFKRVNDQFGHEAGDQVLVDVANTLSHSVRECDICCRIGGEEFVVILSDTHIDEAYEIADRARTTIEKKKIVHDNDLIKLTISCGVSEVTEKHDIYSLIKVADKALYWAKQHGRNQVCRATQQDVLH